MDGRRPSTRRNSQPPDTDLEYYSRPENYKGSNLDNLTSFLLAKSRQEPKPTVVRQKFKRRDQTQDYFKRYRHILSRDLRETSSLSSSASPLSSDEDEDNIVDDCQEIQDNDECQHNCYSRCGETEPSDTWQTTQTTLLGVEEQLSTNVGDLRPERGYRSHMISDLRLVSDTHPQQRTSINDHSQTKNYGMSLHVPVSSDSIRPVTSDSLRPVSSDSVRPSTTSPVGSRLSSAKSQPYYLPRKPTRVSCLQKFKRITQAVVNVLKLAKAIIKRTDSPSALLKTFTALSREPEKQEESENMKNYGLQFDLSYFRANKEITISSEVKNILRLPPSHRTPEQIQTAMFGLQSLPSFAEYPLHMQEKLTKVAWHEIVTPQRTIIRQGHFAENFYFILSGQAVVTIRKPGETSAQTAAIMRKGTSFGELALLHHSRRTATVTSQDTVQLLSVGREDFFDIFMSGHSKGEIPEHIQFISQLDFMKDWPLEHLLERPDQCLLHFFKRNTVIVRDSKLCDWFYVVKSGSCQVLKQLKRVNANLGQPRKRTPAPHGSRGTIGAWPPELRQTKGRQHDRQTRAKEIPKNPPADANITAETRVKDKQQICTPVFVQIELLKPKDVFGLDLVNSHLDSNPPSVSLVSLGAECVMLSKAFFIKNASDSLRKKFAEIIQPYPDEESLQDSLQTKVNWELYKRSLILEVAAHKQAVLPRQPMTTYNS